MSDLASSPGFEDSVQVRNDILDSLVPSLVEFLSTFFADYTLGQVPTEMLLNNIDAVQSNSSFKNFLSGRMIALLKLNKRNFKHHSFGIGLSSALNLIRQVVLPNIKELLTLFKDSELKLFGDVLDLSNLFIVD